MISIEGEIDMSSAIYKYFKGWTLFFMVLKRCLKGSVQRLVMLEFESEAAADRVRREIMFFVAKGRILRELNEIKMREFN